MDWQVVPLDRVIEGIVRVYHPRVRRAVALVDRSLREANGRRRGVGTAFERANDLFSTFRSDLTAHLADEHALVFPVVRALAIGGDRADGTASAVLSLALLMEGTHDDLQARLREVSSACAACAACHVTAVAAERAECALVVRGLSEALEATLLIENGVLYPRAIALDYAGVSGDAPPRNQRIARGATGGTS